MNKWIKGVLLSVTILLYHFCLGEIPVYLEGIHKVNSRDSQLDVPSEKNAHWPVSELHVHADAGILSEHLFNQLVKRNHLTLKSSDFFKEGIIYHQPGDFSDFLRVYDLVSSVIQTEEDISDVVYDYLKRSHIQGGIYTELMVSPEHFNKATKVFSQSGKDSPSIRAKSLSYTQVIRAVSKAITQAKKDFDIEARIIIVILRHKGVKAANKLLDTVIKHPHPYVRGINLAGDDIHYPAGQFKAIYDKARKHGLKLSAHMGEHTGSKDIETALAMKLDRIGHGLSVIQDKTMMKQFKRSGIGIEVCPSSNIDGGNGIFKSLNTHPLKTMLKEGLFVAISTDDPSFLHTNIQDEYRQVQQAYHLSKKQMLKLCENSIRMSFAEPALKRKLLRKVHL